MNTRKNDYSRGSTEKKQARGPIKSEDTESHPIVKDASPQLQEAI